MKNFPSLWRELGAVGFLVLICFSLALREPEFLTVDNLMDVLVQISGVAIAAAGMTFVILTAGIDLSVGSVLALAGCAGALLGQRLGIAEGFMPVLVGIVGTLLVGASCGVVNGLIVTKLGLTPFIATLGVMSMARGLAYVVSDNTPVQVLSGMRQVAKARLAGVPLPIYLLLATYLIGWFILRFTVLGRYTYAIGGNEIATKLSGIRIGGVKVFAYAFCGFLSAISGLIVAGRLGWMAPQEGDGFELDVIAAVVIGGTSLYGGEGSIWGTFLGALIMGVVRNGLNLMAVDYNIQKIVIGAIILLAVTADVFARKYARI